MEDSRLNRGLNAIECLKLIMFVKGRLNFSCKSTTAANVDLAESLLDNWLKNNQITIDKIYYLRSLLVSIFLRTLVFKLFLNRRQPAQKQNPVATR